MPYSAMLCHVMSSHVCRVVSRSVVSCRVMWWSQTAGVRKLLVLEDLSVLPVKRKSLHLLGKTDKLNTMEGPTLRPITERRLKKFKKRLKPWSQQGESGSPEGN